MINNIIFDLGGVLLYKTPESILKEENLNDNDYNILLKFFENWEELDLENKDLNKKFLECNFSNDISNKYKSLLLNYYEKRKINMELIKLAQKLKDNNYKLYILSDNNYEAYLYYSNHELFSIFDGWIVSCEYHTLKKDGILFEKLINKYNLNPRECYFIDDNTENINTAKNYNIAGYKFNEKEDIKKLYDNMKKHEICI